MSKEEFITYVNENFTISGEAYRLISNILDYAAYQGWDESDQHRFLHAMLDGAIGLSDSEIRNISL